MSYASLMAIQVTEELMSADDEVLDKDWTPNADYD